MSADDPRPVTVVATFAFCVVSGIVPFASAELYLLSASALLPRGVAPWLVVAAASGQMVGKTVMYFAGRGALRLPGERLRRTIAEVQRRFGSRQALGDTLLLTSASLGLPPFYLVSIASGMLRVPLVRFLVLGLSGRLVRFAAIVLFPQLGRGWGG